MDPTDAIDRLASGEGVMILATCLVAVCIVVVVLYRRINQLQDKLLNMAENMVEESRDLLKDTNTTISANTEVTRQALRYLEGKR